MKILILFACLTLSAALPTIEDNSVERDGRNIFDDIGNAISSGVSRVANRNVTGISLIRPLRPRLPVVPPSANATIFTRLTSLLNPATLFSSASVSSNDSSNGSIDATSAIASSLFSPNSVSSPDSLSSPVSLPSPGSLSAPGSLSSSPIAAEGEGSVSLRDRITSLVNRVQSVPIRDRISNLANRVTNGSLANRITDTAETAQSGVTNFLGSVGVLRIIPRECETTSAFLKTGMCALESKCVEADGAIAGACERAGVCCVVPIVCGSQVTVKRSWFVNKEFPALVDNVRDSGCEVSIRKSEKTIKQVRLDLNHFELGRAVDGSCAEDSLQIFASDKLLGQIDLIPPLCGVNSGQHVYVDMPEGELAELKIHVKIAEQKGRAISPRSWRILVTQLDETEMAPKGCLQYYTEKVGTIKSLNYDADNVNYVSNMNYDVCFNKISEIGKEVVVEGKQTPGALRICRRDFLDVSLEQSFTGESNKMLTPRHAIAKRNVPAPLPSESRISDNDDKVITQIQHVVSQLQADKNSGLRTVVQNANKLASEKKKVEVKELTKSDTENKPVIDSQKSSSKLVAPAKADDKGSKVVETKPVAKVPKPDVKAAKPEDDKKVTKPENTKNAVKPEDTKNTQDITWLILDDGKKQIPVADVKVPNEKVVNSNVKVNKDENMASKPVAASPIIPEKLVSQETQKTPEKLMNQETPKSPEKVKETDFNSVVLGELLAQHDSSKLQQMAAAKPKPEVIVNDDPIALPEAELDIPTVTLDEEVLIPEDPKPIIKDVQQLTLKDAEEIIKNPACGGTYILVQERAVCGSFVRSNTIGQKDQRFQNAEKISIRSIENPETSLRFSLTYKEECQEVAPTTTTAATTTTTTTTTTKPATTAEPVTAATPTRRVGVIQYLLGWY